MEQRLRTPEELRQLHEALKQGKLQGREVYRAVQIFGENLYLPARPEVESLLHSEDFELRFVALKVLTRYWHLKEHWETARQVLLSDPEVECRVRAAHDLGSLMRNTQDPRTLHVLAQVVQNEQENLTVREAAYAAMKEVLQYDAREQLHMATRRFDFNREVDWNLVNQYSEWKEN